MMEIFRGGCLGREGKAGAGYPGVWGSESAREACPELSESPPGTQPWVYLAVITPLGSLLPWAVIRSLLLSAVNTVLGPGSPGTFLPSQAA